MRDLSVRCCPAWARHRVDTEGETALMKAGAASAPLLPAPAHGGVRCARRSTWACAFPFVSFGVLRGSCLEVASLPALASARAHTALHAVRCDSLVIVKELLGAGAGVGMCDQSLPLV